MHTFKVFLSATRGPPCEEMQQYDLLFPGLSQVISVICNRFLDVSKRFFMSYQTLKKSHGFS